MQPAPASHPSPLQHTLWAQSNVCEIQTYRPFAQARARDERRAVASARRPEGDDVTDRPPGYPELVPRHTTFALFGVTTPPWATSVLALAKEGKGSGRQH